MINPRTSTELWDDNEFEAPLHYPNATRRRAIIAHSLGVVGVLGTLALGIAAIGPHLSYVTNRAQALFAAHRPAPELARPAPQAVPLATAAPTAENAARTPAEVAPPPAPPAVVTPPEPVAAAPEAVVAAPDAVVTPPPAAEPQPPSPSPEATAASPAAAPAAKSVAEEPSTEQASRPAVSSRPARTEPRLTWAEIERRKARYDAWLKDQGLEPVH